MDNIADPDQMASIESADLDLHGLQKRIYPGSTGQGLIWAPPTNVGGALLFSACPSLCLFVVTLTQSFLILFLPNFIYGLLPSTSRSSSNTGFVRHRITKMADKMAATYQYQLSWSL